MCGVIGFVPAQPNTNVPPEICEGLGLLLYRGYDSVGAALAYADGGVEITKMRARGETPERLLLNKMLAKLPGAGHGNASAEHDRQSKNNAGTKNEGVKQDDSVMHLPLLGIGHSRWATHGPANSINAHPHTDCRGQITLVHNGIIENVEEIKSFLAKDGACLAVKQSAGRGEKSKKSFGHFVSDTDSEVVAHLIGYWREQGLAFRQALQKTLPQLLGSFSFLVLDSQTPGVLLAVRRGSPLVLGVRPSKSDTGARIESRGKSASQDIAVVSSAEPLAKFGYKQIYPLADNELVAIRPGSYAQSVSFYNARGPVVVPKLSLLAVKSSAITKGDNDTFFVKEIKEQPEATRTVLAGHYDEGAGLARLGGFANWSSAGLKKVRRVWLVAEGSSLHAAEIGAFWLRRFAGLDVSAALASELAADIPPFKSEQSLFIIISQSGETADVRVAAEEILRRGGRLFGLVNVVGSSLARLVGQKGGGMYTHAGPEISVASSKVYTAQLSQLAILTLFFARNVGGLMSRQEALRWIEEHQKIPALMEQVLSSWPQIRRAAARLAAAPQGILFIGRGANLTTAREGALKMRELSYLNAVAYSAGEMKHGTIALIDKNFPTVAVALRDNYYDKMLGNLHEIKARGGPLITLANPEDKKIKELSDQVIELPESYQPLSPIINVLPLQILAYEVAKLKGRRIDRPRNLAKSVTVS